MRIKVGVVDDHKPFLEGFSYMLDSSGFDVVLQARNGLDLQHQLDEYQNQPDLIIIDIDLPVIEGLETTECLQQHHPSIKLIAIAMEERDKAIISMLKAGCCSYLYEYIEPQGLKKALQNVYTYGYFNPDT